VTPELRNWSGTYQFTAREVIAARTIGEVQQAVAAGGRVRAIGTRHSFNDLADNGATLVSVTGIAPDPVVDEAAGTVTVGAGTSYGALAAWLQDRGLALANLGSLPHISIAGATATGTHGSGSGNRILSAAVAGLEYVAADGELRRAGREHPDFDGMPVGLGAFGIVVRVALDIEPTYLVRQDAYTGLPWDRVLADTDAIMDAAYSVSLFTDWSGESLRAAWVKRRVQNAETDDTPEEFFGARRDPGPVRFIDAPADNLTVLGTAGPWSQRLPHFRLDSTPSNGDEIQSEYFVDRRHGPAALEALRRRSKSITPLLMISEIRATAKDRLWLSGSYGRETMALHFTWRNRPDQVDVVLKDVEEALEPFAARPHWGKVSHVTAARVAQLYPRLGDATELFQRLDPDGRFSNQRLERLGVRAARSSRPLPAGTREGAGDQVNDAFCPWLLEEPEQLRADLLRVRPAQAVTCALDGDVLTAADELVRTGAAGLDRQDAVCRAVQDEDRDVDLPQVVAEVLVPRGHAGDSPLGRGADRGVPRVLHHLGADQGAERLVQVEEVLVPLGEVGRAVGGQRGRDLVEYLLRHGGRRLRGLEQVRGDARDDDGPLDPPGTVLPQVARDLAAAHRVAGEAHVVQVKCGEELIKVGGEGVVVIADDRLA